VTDPSGDSVSKVSPDPAAAGKAAPAEPAQTAKQQGQDGSSGGGSPTTPEVTPEVAPVSEPSATPDDAPVYDTEPSVTPDDAPVVPSDPRPQFGYELARGLVIVLGGTILLLWVYILALDLFETSKVNESYSRIIAAAEPTLNSPEIMRIDAVLERISSLQRTPPRTFTPEETAATKESVRQIAFRLQPAQTVSLNECVQLMQPTENSQPAPPQPTAANQPGPQAQPQTASTGPVQPGTKERAALIENCIKTLESVRYAVGGPMDTDRLRVMRDFAKDVHESHQGLRTFWTSATQLVLVNVLLPLLTALLGYIFGRQASG